MSERVETVVMSVVTSAVTMLSGLAMGLGKQPAQNVYMTDGTNIQKLITAMNDKVDKITGVLSDAITNGTKKIRTDILDQAKDTYRQEEARIKAEAEAAKKLAAEKRDEVKSNPAATLFNNK